MRIPLFIPHSVNLSEPFLGTFLFRWLMLAKLSLTLNLIIGHHSFIV